MRSAERAALDGALPPALRNDRTLVGALDLVLSFTAWQHLRRDQRLAPAQARNTIEAVVRALIGAAKS